MQHSEGCDSILLPKDIEQISLEGSGPEISGFVINYDSFF